MSMALRAMSDTDLDCVLQWRNHPEIRKWMFSSHQIAREEHVDWFNKVRNDPLRHLLIQTIDDHPQGFMNIHVDEKSRNAVWGFYVSPSAPPGTGRTMCQNSIKHAFGQLGIHKLSGEVIDFNQRSIAFHQKLGFHQEGVLRDHHFSGHQYHDVHLFGLLPCDRIAK